MILLAVVGFGSEKSYGHDPDFAVITTEDVLKFCGFFYEEYQLLGADALAQQHTNYPNLRGCVMLYNHIAWNSTHEGRNLVLVAEINKYLGDSSYIKERHIEYSEIIPEWIKREAQLWVNNENQDMGFAYGIRTLLEAGVISMNFNDRKCVEDKICLRENDFIKYTHFDKYGNSMSIKHTVTSIKDNEFTENDSEINIEIEKISQEGITKEEMILNNEGLMQTDVCCKYYEFVIALPIEFGDSISEEMKINAETTYTWGNQARASWLASDMTGQNIKIIDKESGLVLSHKFHETEVLTVGDETKITDTNFFDTKYDMSMHEIAIPGWWKIATSWLLDERISESEYLRGIENLISRNIIKV